MLFSNIWARITKMTLYRIPLRYLIRCVYYLILEGRVFTLFFRFLCLGRPANEKWRTGHHIYVPTWNQISKFKTRMRKLVSWWDELWKFPLYISQKHFCISFFMNIIFRWIQSLLYFSIKPQYFILKNRKYFFFTRRK